MADDIRSEFEKKLMEARCLKNLDGDLYKELEKTFDDFNFDNSVEYRKKYEKDWLRYKYYQYQKQLKELKQKYADREQVVEEKVRPFVIMKEEMMSRKDKHYNQVTISWQVLFDLVELLELIKGV